MIFLWGIVQGLTEFLPISSSGHVLVISSLTGRTASIGLQEALHVGTFFSLLEWFWPEGKQWLKAILQKKDPQSFKRPLLLTLSFLPVGVLGFFGQSWISTFHRPYNVTVGLILGGFLLLAAELGCKGSRQEASFSWKDSIVLGAFQLLSFFPGMSRSGSVLSGSRFLGFSSHDGAKISFWMAVPVMAAITIHNIFWWKNASLEELFAVILAWFVGRLVLNTFLGYLKNHGLLFFAIYRIVLGFFFLIFLEATALS